MAFATAKFWGILPHVIWRFPFRYYRELRDFYIATLAGPRADVSVDRDSGAWDTESFSGGSL